eukprot:gene24274-9875_t
MKLSAIILISLAAAVCGQNQPVDDKKGKLPYNTGSIVNVTASVVRESLSFNLLERLRHAEYLVRAQIDMSVKLLWGSHVDFSFIFSKWLSLTCEVREDKKYPDGSGCMKAGDDVDHHHKKAPAFLEFTVFCNKSLDPADDKDDCGGQGGKGGKGGGDCMGYWDCALKTAMDSFIKASQSVFSSQPGSLRGIHTIEPTFQTPTETSDEVDLQMGSAWGSQGVFASQPGSLRGTHTDELTAQTPTETSDEASQGVFSSQPGSLRGIHTMEPTVQTLTETSEASQGVFSSQPGSLRGIHTMEPTVQTLTETSEVELHMGSAWDVGGFLLMGTDFTSADIMEGTPVFLKSQVAHKFCRVDPINMWAIVCDSMTSGGTQGGGTGDGVEQKFELAKAPADLLLALQADNVNYPVGPPGGDDDKSEPEPMIIRSTMTGRYCAPDRKLHHSAPLTCNFKESELTHKQVLLFTVSSPYPPYKSGAKAAAPSA